MVSGAESGMTPTIKCEDCDSDLPLQVLHSGAGYYIGRHCPQCGPYSRETGYYKYRDIAEYTLAGILRNHEEDRIRKLRGRELDAEIALQLGWEWRYLPEFFQGKSMLLDPINNPGWQAAKDNHKKHKDWGKKVPIWHITPNIALNLTGDTWQWEMEESFDLLDKSWFIKVTVHLPIQPDRTSPSICAIIYIDDMPTKSRTEAIATAWCIAWLLGKDIDKPLEKDD